MRWGSVEGLWVRRGNGGDIAPLRQLLCFSSKRGMALLCHDLPLKVAASHYIPKRGMSLKSLSGLPKLWGEYFFSLHKLLSDVFDIARECCLIWVCAGLQIFTRWVVMEKQQTLPPQPRLRSSMATASSLLPPASLSFMVTLMPWDTLYLLGSA